MKTPVSQRIVAIVGRPNVGKSALFNRMVGRRLSIVHEEIGVTRDRVVAEASVGGERFTMIDTGGLGMLDGELVTDRIEAGIRGQIDAALSDAHVFLLAVDVMAGLQPLDREVAGLLRQSGRKVFLLANKSDNDDLEKAAVDFSDLGFPVFPVSALHNRGFEPLLKELLSVLPEEEPVTVAEPVRVAVVGRPNAGKSSYLNRILNEERLIVSDVPGTTRDTVELPFSIGEGEQARHYLLTDTAGLRHIRRASTAVEKFSVIRAERAIERADVVVLMLDAQKGPSRQDKRIASIIQEARKGCLILVNKWDLAEGKVTQREYLESFRAELPFLAHVPVLFVSAHNGYQIRKSVDAIDEVAAAVTSTLTTGTLNRVLRDAMEKVGPPLVKGKRFKLLYATQLGMRPIRIGLFCNDRAALSPSYEAYLIGRLRRAYPLDGAPVIFVLKAREPRKSDQAVVSGPSLRRGAGKPKSGKKAEKSERPVRIRRGAKRALGKDEEAPIRSRRSKKR
ncbi:MAG TPA: ribosome biogenesis GTPase Der [Kiritimatiellia bacterium]|nr:ribosome biogenesis GTPase Der [Kiritimatiellia bacterium]